MKVKVYGTGCAKCGALYDNVRTALDFAGVDTEIEKVADLQEIARAGILSTPALEIDGRVLFSGKVPTFQEILEVLPEGECSGGTEAAPCRCGEKPAVREQAGCCCCGGGKGGASLPRRLLTYLLLTFVGVAVAIMVLRETGATGAGAAPEETAALPEQDVMTVYLFHGNQRCPTCQKFESLAREVLETEYARELAEGRIRFLPVNVEDAANAHFIRDFGLTSESLVLSTPSGYRNLDKIWVVIFQGEETFKEYLRGNLREMREQDH
ncbi:MAG: nitrophenyl compound nitroreductase subunit ArsF family protein [Oligosphaeraceae bacterium]